jgi:protein phosphatase PTC7
MIGVADGVGGIADELKGVNPSDLPKELMERCKDMSFLRKEDPEEFLGDTAEILREHGVDCNRDQWTTYLLMRSWLECQNWGATTALVLSVEDGMISAAQYGDSCFMHLRKNPKKGWEIMYRSQPQTHAFLCPYQLCRKPLKKGKKGMNNYAEANVQWQTDLFFSSPKQKVSRGDLIIAGSDGLFDNLYDHEIVDLITKQNAISSESSEDIANALYSKASEAAESDTKPTPFADAADAEYKQPGKKAFGGRPDDITVVVAFVGDDDEDESSDDDESVD